MRVLQHLKGHVGALALIFLLLIGQAVCDLALPTFTSVIVDVGIQQRGIEHATPSEMRAETYTALDALVESSDRAAFEAAYEQGDDSHYRLAEAAQADIDALDRMLTAPEAALAMGGSDGLDDMSENIVLQRAIAFVQQEYEACGIDVNAIQMGYLVKTGGLMLLVTLGMVICSVLVGLIASRAGAEIARSLRERLFTKVVSFGAEELDRFSTASLITRSTNDITQVQMVLIMLMRMVLYAPILGIGGIIMISTTNVSMSWIIVLAVALVIGLVATLFGITYPKFRIMQKLIDRVNLVSRESLTGVQVVRAFRREDIAQDRFDLASGDLMRTQLFTSRAMMFMFPGMTLIMNGASALIVWTAAQQIDLGAMQVGEMIAFITYAMVIITSFLMMSTIAIMLPRANVAATRIDEVLHTEPAIVDPEHPVELEALGVSGGGGPSTPPLRGSARDDNGVGIRACPVEFDNVTFHYGDAEKAVLHDITFTANPGQTTAIIGGTGSGKSTVLNLIPRFHDVNAGSVRVAGIDVRDLRQSDLRSLIGFVPQKSALFSGTIESNLKFAGPQVSDDDMREAARVAQAAEFVEAHPDGYAREVAQGGTNVSGGQRQRLAIARALAKHAPVLLFDDSFSALDYKTDQALRAELRKTAGDATVIIVAQRIATILHADQIIVLDRGRIAGIGTHEELLRSCTVYREIAKSQLSPEELALEGGVR
ncbi:MAG: ABC transporter ATP-binding protein [Coriobacteriia bacterium]|nr:ABC transporter ATP-binding protein [Coriobacteriia bacterium]